MIFLIKNILKKRFNMRVEILIRKVRKEKNIKLEDLARLSGISKGTLSKIERQEQEPRFSNMVMIALALKVNITDLYKIHF